MRSNFATSNKRWREQAIEQPPSYLDQSVTQGHSDICVQITALDRIRVGSGGTDSDLASNGTLAVSDLSTRRAHIPLSWLTSGRNDSAPAKGTAVAPVLANQLKIAYRTLHAAANGIITYTCINHAAPNHLHRGYHKTGPPAQTFALFANLHVHVPARWPEGGRVRAGLLVSCRATKLLCLSMSSRTL